MVGELPSCCNGCAQAHYREYDIHPGPPYNGTGLSQGNSPIVVSGNINSLFFSGLQPGQIYYFNVQPVNDFGMGDYADEISVEADCTPCGSVTFSDPITQCDLEAPFIVNYQQVKKTSEQVSVRVSNLLTDETVTFTGYSFDGIIDIKNPPVTFSLTEGKALGFGAGEYRISLQTQLCNIVHTIDTTIFIDCLIPVGGFNAANSSSISDLHMYPNPTKGILTLDATKVKEPYNMGHLRYTIRDLTGKAILSKLVDSDVCTIDLGRLSQGIYFIDVESGGRRVFQDKFVLLNND